VSDTLIDSSAWVDFFRGDPAAVARIDPLLADARAAISGPIYAEVTSGAKSKADFERLKARLASLDWLEEPEDLWNEVARARFLLARQGHPASIVDLMIAATANARDRALLTRDRDFVPISKVIAIDLRLF
jgi:predicted nucleic acid-binding protein